MFESAYSVFQHIPNYDGELLQLYQLRKEKYTISNAEIKLLQGLLLPNDKIPDAIQTNSRLQYYDNKAGKSTLFAVESTGGYAPLMNIIQYQIEHIQDQNNEIAKHPIKRFLPDWLVKKSTTKLRIALKYVKYHHYNYMALQHPDMAFNNAFGIEANKKFFESTFLNIKGKRLSLRKYSAKNIANYLFAKSSVFFFFRKKEIAGLADAFQQKLDTVRTKSRQLNIVKNKYNLHKAINKQSIQKYQAMQIKGPVISQPSTPFIKRLVSFLGFTPAKKSVNPPIRNIMIQEVNAKLADKTLSELEKSKIKAAVNFTKRVPASNIRRDYAR
jgi:hypothetical protein